MERTLVARLLGRVSGTLTNQYQGQLLRECFRSEFYFSRIECSYNTGKLRLHPRRASGGAWVRRRFTYSRDLEATVTCQRAVLFQHGCSIRGGRYLRIRVGSRRCVLDSTIYRIVPLADSHLGHTEPSAGHQHQGTLWRSGPGLCPSRWSSSCAIRVRQAHCGPHFVGSVVCRGRSRIDAVANSVPDNVVRGVLVLDTNRGTFGDNLLAPRMADRLNAR